MSVRVNGLVGRRVIVVVVDLGSDIYLCSEYRMSWVHRAEARENKIGFKAEKDRIMTTCAWDAGFTKRGKYCR